MKKFLFKTFIFILITVIISVSLSYIIDPFNVFHALNIRDNGVEPNKNYIKMKYILNNPDKFNSFVFGSSRVGNIHVDHISDQKAYNMTYSEATPKEILDNVKTLINNNIIPKHLYVGVDNLSYTINPERHLNESGAPYELSIEKPFKFYLYYLDPAVSLKSYLTIISKHNVDESYAYRFYSFGWNSDYGNHTTTYDFNNAEPSIGEDYRLEETLNEIQELVNICKENDIELVIFTNPLYPATYEAALNQNYYDFLRELANITEFCNFSGYNDISTNDEYWIDNSHYTAEASDLVLECICYRAYYWPLYDQGFGQWINSSNINEFINLLENTREEYLNNNQ